MVLKSDFKWASSDQMRERLEGTYLLLEGQPVRVLRIPRMTSLEVQFPSGATSEVEVSRFGDFRQLPPLGWVNLYSFGTPTAVLLTRIAQRRTKHGLTHEGVTVRDAPFVNNRSRVADLDMVFRDKGYADRVKGEYPSALEIVENLLPTQSAAFSPKYAFEKTSEGVMFLYRLADRIGIVASKGIKLFPALGYRKDELLDLSELSMEVEVM